MFHRFFKIALLLFCACFLFGCNNSDDSSSVQTLKVVMSADYPPFEFYKNGRIVGFDVDLIHAIAKKIDKNVEITDGPFETLIGALQTRRADVCISALSATDERRKSVDFAKSYHVSQSVIVYVKNDRIKGSEDFSGKNIGVQMGSTYENFAKAWQKDGKGPKSIQSLSKVPDLIQSLKIGRIDGIMMGVHEAKAVLKQAQGFEKPLMMIDVPSTQVDYAIALPKDSPLLNDVNKAIDELVASGVIEQFVEKWFHDVSPLQGSH